MSERIGPDGATPLVSVVIATYNMARYLPQALRSVLLQTYPNLEIIVVDDGSTDATPVVIEPFRSSPAVRYIRQANAGQAAAKNHGVREARGEYIAFLDADDFWVDDKLAAQVPLLQRSPDVGVVYSRLHYVDANGTRVGVSDNELFRGDVSGALFVRNFIGFGTAVARRACFECLGGFDESLTMGIDYDLWLRFSTRYRFDYVDRPLLCYRRWPGQMSNDTSGRYRNGMLIMERFLREHPGRIGRRAEREGWAHTYVGLGFCVWEAERRPTAAMAMFVRALRHKLTYLPAWRALFFAASRIRWPAS